MKNAQEILQFSGYPLEPQVALEIKKTLDAQLAEKRKQQALYVQLLSHSYAAQWDLTWYGNYE